MCDPVTAIVGGAILGAGASAAQGAMQAKAMKKASKRAQRQAELEAASSSREFNRLNQKSPNLGAILGKNQLATGGGVGSTMLTGPNGVSAGSMSTGGDTLIGRNTLLGA